MQCSQLHCNNSFNNLNTTEQEILDKKILAETAYSSSNFSKLNGINFSPIFIALLFK